MHRPYKLYSVVATQSGVPSAPFLPTGSALYGTGSNFIGPDTYALPENQGGRPELTLGANAPTSNNLNGMYNVWGFSNIRKPNN